MSENTTERNIVVNRKARYNYNIEETIEAGIALVGTEVKSLRERKVNMGDSYAQVVDGEIYLCQMHISPYKAGNRFNHDPTRRRKLLLHRRQINYLIGQIQQKGKTLIPLRLYFKNGFVKVELAIARGKHLYDKRQDIAKREAQREIERAMRSRY